MSAGDPAEAAFLEQAESAGFMAGRHGADKENSHFAFFATPETTAAWERGLKRGTDALAEYSKAHAPCVCGRGCGCKCACPVCSKVAP